MPESSKVIENDGAYCSFCGKSKREVNKLVAGTNACICNECIVLSNAIIQDEEWEISDLGFLNGQFIYELLEMHFAPMALESIISYSYLFPTEVGIKCQETIESLLKSEEIKFKFVGIGRRFKNSQIEVNFSELWEKEYYPFFVGPIQYEIMEFSKGFENKCLKNGLWLCVREDVAFAIYLDYRGGSKESTEGIYFEIASIGEDLSYVEMFLSLVHARVYAS